MGEEKTADQFYSDLIADPKTADQFYADLIEDLGGAESLLQDVVAGTSIEVFGASVKSFAEKGILFAVIGLLVSTVGVVDKEATLGPFKIRIEHTWLVQATISFITLYCAIALCVLARTDFRRWSATYSLKALKVQELCKRLTDVVVRDMKNLKDFGDEIHRRLDMGEFQDTPDGDVPYPLKERAKLIEGRTNSVSALVRQITNPGARMRRQAKAQLAIFVMAPVIFCIVSFLVCLTSAVRTYIALASVTV